jgi:signal transduction histidine kinase
MSGVLIEVTRTELVCALRQAGFAVGAAIHVVERGPDIIVLSSDIEPVRLTSTVAASDLVAVVKLVAQLREHRERSAAIAHDACNLLVPITAAVFELPDGGVGGELVASCTRVGAILRRMSRQVPTTSETNIGERVTALLPTLSAITGSRCSVSVEVANTPAAKIDALDLDRVLVNLVANARDASAANIRINVRAEAAASVVLLVEDDGAGMDAETLLRAREPFFTTKGTHGTGLGLASVERIARAVGGELAIDSAPGVGTRVRVSIPTQ